jgi:hypothetical protein
MLCESKILVRTCRIPREPFVVFMSVEVKGGRIPSNRFPGEVLVTCHSYTI